MAVIRAILGLSRVHYLPTIWSNCLAGWWLGFGGNTEWVPLLLGGATLIFFGGMLLNDALDAEHDQQEQPGKPIPAGLISRRAVWRSALLLFALGALLLLWLGGPTGILGLLLVSCLIAFNALHRFLPGGPFILGACRFLLYLLGASITIRGITGWAIWSGLALGAYAAGTAYFRSWGGKPSDAAPWPIVLLGVPIGLALLINTGTYRQAALLLALVLALWIIRALRQSIWSSSGDYARGAASLTAGIVLADWLAVAHGPRELSFTFIGLFLAALILQTMTTPRKVSG